MKVKTNRKTNITTTYPKLRDTVEHRIIKYKMVLSYEQNDLELVDAFHQAISDEPGSNLIDFIQRTTTEYFSRFDIYRSEIKRLEKLDPNTELSDFFIHPALMHVMSKDIVDMTKEEKNYLTFLNSQKVHIANERLHMPGCFHNSRTLPCSTRKHIGLEPQLCQLGFGIPIENEDFDCLIVRFCTDDMDYLKEIYEDNK